MKKFLSIILCLALIAALPCVSVQAAAPTLGVACPETSAAGETITVDIMADSLNNCCGVAFHMGYDPELMEVVDITKAESLGSWFLEDNYVYAPGELAVTLISANAANLSGKIASVTFEIKSSARGEASFSLSKLEAVTPSSSAIALEGKDGTTTISSMAQAMLSVTPSAGENGAVVLNIDLSKASYYCGLTFILNYDHSRYTVSSAEKVGGFASTLGAVNPAYGEGQVFISTAFITPSSLNGTLATVTLSPIAGATGEVGDVSLNIARFVDSSYESLDIGWAYKTVSVSGLSDNGSAVSATANFFNSGVAAKNVTAFMALYSADGRFLGIDSESLSISSGSCGSFPLSLGSNSKAAYAKFFFVDESFRPVAADICQELPAA